LYASDGNGASYASRTAFDGLVTQPDAIIVTPLRFIGPFVAIGVAEDCVAGSEVRTK
jgi:hypothetical protein